MGYNPRQALAQNISSLGSFFRVPNMGVSGTIASQNPQKVVQPAFGLRPMPSFSVQAAGPTNVQRTGAVPTTQYNQPIGPSPNTNSGNVNTGGNTGGQVPSGQTGGGGDQGTPYEQAPDQPSIDYDALIAPALSALDQAVAPNQSTYEADVAGIEANRSKGKGELAQSYAQGQTEASRNRERVSGQSESAIDESRRQFAEIQQGLQARYGGTTGSGAFAEGLAGRQTLQNIGQQRQALTQAITTIDDRLEQVRSLTDLASQDIDQQAEAQKSQAKAQLDNVLNSIRIARGELMSRKVELAQQAMQFYQQQVGEVNARNASFKQNLYVQQQAAQQKLAEAKSRASQEIEKFSLMNLGSSDAPNFNWVGSQSQTIRPATYGAGQMVNAGMGAQDDDPLAQLNAQAQ